MTAATTSPEKLQQQKKKGGGGGGEQRLAVAPAEYIPKVSSYIFSRCWREGEEEGAVKSVKREFITL